MGGIRGARAASLVELGRKAETDIAVAGTAGIHRTLRRGIVFSVLARNNWISYMCTA